MAPRSASQSAGPGPARRSRTHESPAAGGSRRPRVKPAPSAAESERASARVRGRPKVISDEALLAVARQVFLERGIRATTAEVAERAGIAEGTVFLRFKSKDALFRAAVCVDPSTRPEFVETFANSAGKGDLRQNLIEFTTRLLEFKRIALPVILMSWSNPGGEFAFEKTVERNEGYRSGFRAVRRFFEAEMRAGRLGPSNAELLTRIFMGSVHHFCMSELLLPPEEGKRLTVPAFAEGLVDVLLRAAPGGKRAAGKRTARVVSGERSP
jgi:AcrR family transcriptional regulator